MIVVYDINTQFMGTARDIAMRRALAEGWSRATIIGVQKYGDSTYEITLTVFK